MARWEIKNVGMKGVAMTVPENVVKTSELGLLSQEEADVFDNTVGIKERHIAPDTMCASDMCQAAAEKWNRVDFYKKVFRILIVVIKADC